MPPLYNRFPHFGYPFNRFHPPYGNNGYSYTNPSSPEIKKDYKKETNLYNEHINRNNQNILLEKNNDSSKPIFEIFGIKLFFDDILLICLIFFLYNEGVKDKYLFISLILLLLS